jgi:hypothetical protein
VANQLVKQRKQQPDVMALKIRKNMKKEAVQLIVNKLFESWVKENPELLNDINKLSTEILSFNIKWGTKLTISDLIEKTV